MDYIPQQHQDIIARFFRSVKSFFKKMPFRRKKSRCPIDKWREIVYHIAIRLSQSVAYAGLRQGRANRGDSGALYLQSATAGANPGPRGRTVSPDPCKQ